MFNLSVWWLVHATLFISSLWPYIRGSWPQNHFCSSLGIQGSFSWTVEPCDWCHCIWFVRCIYNYWECDSTEKLPWGSRKLTSSVSVFLLLRVGCGRGKRGITKARVQVRPIIVFVQNNSLSPVFTVMVASTPIVPTLVFTVVMMVSMFLLPLQSFLQPP